MVIDFDELTSPLPDANKATTKTVPEEKKLLGKKPQKKQPGEATLEEAEKKDL